PASLRALTLPLGRSWIGRREGLWRWWRPLPKPLSQRVRRPLCLLKSGNDRLVPGRGDPEPILAERPHLHLAPRCLDPQERRRCAALPGLGLAIGHGVRSVARCGRYFRTDVGET